MRAIFAVGDARSAAKYLPGRWALISYAYWGTSWLEGIEKVASTFAGLVIDSGAFTIWNREQSGKAPPGGITVESYAEFLTKEAPQHAWALSLDVIGNAEASMAQFARLRALLPSRNIVPIYHEGDPIEHLDAYCAASDLVALGRIEGRRSERKSLEFYDTVFNHCPGGKFHALGNASPATLELYPFDSFDSTTWQRNAAYSNALGWPYNRCSKDTRIQAFLEATETIAYRPARQLSLRME